MTLIERLNSRAWEHRQHRQLREEAARRITDLEIALGAALSFMQDRHPDHSDGHAQMVIAAVRDALRKDRD